MAKVFSTEDGTLGNSTRVVKQLKYSDLDLSFAARIASDGDVYKKTDAAAVKQAIKTLLLTNHFEKPYRPKFGGNLGGLLFSLADEGTGAEISDRIKRAIQRYEPRAEVLSLKVTSTVDYNSVNVRLEFRVVSTNAVEILDVKLQDTGRAPVPRVAAATQPIDDMIPEVYNDAIFSNDENVIVTHDGKIIQRT